MVVGFLLVLTAQWPATRLGSEFMPSTFPGISIGKAQELLQQTDKMIRTVPEVRTVFGKIGREIEEAIHEVPGTLSVFSERVVGGRTDLGSYVAAAKHEVREHVKLPPATRCPGPVAASTCSAPRSG